MHEASHRIVVTGFWIHQFLRCLEFTYAKGMEEQTLSKQNKVANEPQAYYAMLSYQCLPHEKKLANSSLPHAPEIVRLLSHVMR